MFIDNSLLIIVKYFIKLEYFFKLEITSAELIAEFQFFHVNHRRRKFRLASKKAAYFNPLMSRTRIYKI